MSDVRLSNGSPTLERTDTGRVSVHPKPSACRSLFGAPDYDERQRELKGLLREMEEAASAKWDFDFACHTPRPSGRYAWEAVDCRDVPAFYRDKEAVRTAGRNGVDLNGNVSCAAGAPTGGEAAGRSDGARECREQCGGPWKRPASHDPPAQNKRSHSSTEEVGPLNLSRPAELTPRKKSPRRQT